MKKLANLLTLVRQFHITTACIWMDKHDNSLQRRYDIDWLRVVGVLLLVPFHAALIFVLDPRSVMYIKDAVNSQLLGRLAGFIHMWHMPMLFIVSGSATFFALGFRSAGQYIRERFLLLFIPLVFGVVTYIPLTTYIQHSNTISLSEAYPGFFHVDLAHLDGVNGSFTPAHLWFILYLFILSLIAWSPGQPKPFLDKNWEPLTYKE